jgi:SAM-dependent methyltransferase
LKTVKNCPVCGSEDLILEKRHRFTLGQRLKREAAPLTYEEERLQVFFQEIWTESPAARIDIEKCGSCGMLFSNPRFTPEEISLKYETLDRSGSVWKRQRENPPLRTGERAARIHSLIRDALGETPRGLRILDYGGAQGYNLLPFLQQNQCFLLDYVTHEYPEGIVRLGNDIEDLGQTETFDVILACHVLEHAIDPLRLAMGLARQLSNNGLLYVEVPLGAFREWKKLKEPLTHVNFFSEESICNCIEKAGMDTISLRTVFQWVTHSRRWNVILIAGNHAGGRCPSGIEAAYKSTRRQMSNPLYYVPLLTRQIRRMADMQD